MKIYYTLVVVFLLAIGSVNAQQPMKFGHINSAEILQAMPELKAIEEQMEAEFEQKESQLMTMQQDLQTKQQSYQQDVESLSAAERQAREQELMELNQKVQNFYLLSQQQIQAKQNELQAPVIQKLQAAIQEVGDEEGFLYIFEMTSRVPVFASDKSIDVGALVKAKLGIQ
ncbi:OmpH family outer membrane protein [Carboxylicivirga sediminis]|uniref:OmpH family outer membrane protein n=1 Tax=Carboxylicivirga sediminis TaxID=2006564 RepID=A0A941IX88_9BACT|nr:OmpH family outer membrane protein [Carboxylicivirga sediminis]MBR8536506.1 OmpH family outer membrane protein [Carboxylicivirga sediminis]